MSVRTAIREQVTISDALGLLDLDQPNNAGKMCCPFHDEHTPSMHVYDDHVHCYGCGFNGDVVWFVAQLTGQPLWRAEEFLAGTVDDLEAAPAKPVVAKPVIDLTDVFNRQPETGPMLRELAVDLVRDRWPVLKLEDIERRFAVKVCRDGLWIPHFTAGRITGIKVCKFNGKKESVSGSTFRPLYRSPILAVSQVYLVLCEGEPDTWAMSASAGAVFVSTVGLPSGASTYTDEMHAELCRYSRVYLALDADKAGRTATVNVVTRLSAAGVECVDLTPRMEPFGGDVCDALHAGWVPRFTV